MSFNYKEYESLSTEKLCKLLKDSFEQILTETPDTYAFSGEYDGSQTKFETLSNNMKICVYAPKQYIVPCLAVLRMHIDNNWALLKSGFDLVEDGEEFDDFLTFATCNERDSFESYGESGPILENMSVTLRSRSGTYEVKPTKKTKIYTPKDLYKLI
jgi:hypothetical protein